MRQRAGGGGLAARHRDAPGAEGGRVSRSGGPRIAATRQEDRKPIRPDEVAALERGMAYIRAHFATRPRLDAVADAAGLSPYHFHRRFRLHFGRTPLDAIARLQVAKAQRLLTQGVALARIATRCGFANQSHFTSRFKDRVGKTPAQWLHEHRGRGAPAPRAAPRNG